MKLFICLVLIILLILLIRLKVRVSYDENGFLAWFKVLFFKIKLPPDKKEKTEKQHTAEKKNGGKLSEITDIVTVALGMLGRAITSIRIDNLQADVIIATDDAFKTAMAYGSAAAGCGILLPVIENNFKIKKKEITAHADFESGEMRVSLNAQVSIAVWQVLWLGIVFAWRLIKKKGSNENGRSCTQ